jgi:hypothetical protein
MLAGLLPRLAGGVPLTSRVLRLDMPEGEVAGPLGELAADFPALSIGSYPFIRDGVFGAQIVLRGTDPAEVDAALAALKARLGV